MKHEERNRSCRTIQIIIFVNNYKTQTFGGFRGSKHTLPNPLVPPTTHTYTRQEIHSTGLFRELSRGWAGEREKPGLRVRRGGGDFKGDFGFTRNFLHLASMHHCSKTIGSLNASRAQASPYFHPGARCVQRAKVRGHATRGPSGMQSHAPSPRQGASPESALPAHPGHLFLLLTAEGLPRRLLHRAGGRTEGAAVANPRAWGRREPGPTLGPWAPGQETGRTPGAPPACTCERRAPSPPGQLHPPLRLRTRSPRRPSNGAGPPSGGPSCG